MTVFVSYSHAFNNTICFYPLVVLGLQETPLPVDPSLFPTWPARSEMQKRAVRFDRDSAASKGTLARWLATSATTGVEGSISIMMLQISDYKN